jgi:hypothetical protein
MLSDITYEVIQELNLLVQNNAGLHPLKLIVQDHEEAETHELEMALSSKKVNANFEFVNGLKELGIGYKLN